MKMSHEEYIEMNRNRVGELSRGMLEGTVDYLEGSIELASLRFEIDVPEDDKDLLIFSGISSEIDHLPIGKVREQWSKQALERLQPEIKKSTEWAKEISSTQCRSLSERFNA